MHEEKVHNSRDDFPALGDSAVCAVGTLNAAAPPAKEGFIYERKTSCEMMMGVCVRDKDDELCRVGRLHSPLESGDDGPDLELRRDISRASGILATHSCWCWHQLQKRAKKSHVKSRRVSQSVFCLQACAVLMWDRACPDRYMLQYGQSCT